MDNSSFVKLCSKAWTLPVLACLAEGTPCRVAPIAAKLGAGRTSVSAAFPHLLELRLLQKNPGHGHPLRPEFELTVDGKALSDWAASVLADMPGKDHAFIRKQWTLPILRLFHRPRRYCDIRSQLQPITDRALSISLKEMTALNWISRTVDDAHAPPQVIYRPGRFVTQMHPVIAESFELQIA
ncbi:MAG: winged helix-turn-helix transcriptional regulator [Pseudomonadota bacterium]